MVTKGIIKSIDYSSNTCVIRIPLFEGTSSNNEALFPAITSVPPGVFNGYVEGDVVMIAFENNEISQPVVIGKLYLGVQKESEARGMVGCDTLSVKNKATIPVQTYLSYDRNIPGIADVADGIDEYGSIVDIIKKIKDLETAVKLLQNSQ